MLGRLSQIAAAISIAVFVCTLLLWARSYYYADTILAYGNGCTLEGQSDRGSLSIGYAEYGTSFLSPEFLNVRWRSTRRYSLPFKFLLRSLLDFGMQPWAVPPRGIGQLNAFSYSLPHWTICAVAAVLPVRLFLRTRSQRKALRYRQDVRWVDPRLISRIARFAVFCSIGALVAGLSSVSLNNSGGYWDRMNWYWYSRMAFLLPVVIVMAVSTRRRVRFHRALLWMSLETAGCLCFFQFTLDQLAWHGGLGGLDSTNLLTPLLGVWIVSCVFGAILLLFLQVKPEPVKPGPYCPQCGYCLIGSTRKICTECGRPFTLEELGITAETLVPIGAPR